jgi:hypothetical protein
VIRVAPTGADWPLAPTWALRDGVNTPIGRGHDEPPKHSLHVFMNDPRNKFGDVSRDHVWLRADGREVVVCDASKRGTFTDDGRMTKGQAVRFRPPVKLRLAGSCWVWVEVWDERQPEPPAADS